MTLFLVLLCPYRKPPGVGHGRGRRREDGGSGRPANGIRRGQDDSGSKCMGGGPGKGATGGRVSSGQVIAKHQTLCFVLISIF